MSLYTFLKEAVPGGDVWFLPQNVCSVNVNSGGWCISTITHEALVECANKHRQVRLFCAYHHELVTNEWIACRVCRNTRVLETNSFSDSKQPTFALHSHPLDAALDTGLG